MIFQTTGKAFLAIAFFLIANKFSLTTPASAGVFSSTEAAADTTEWRRLLFYAPRYLRPASGLIDSNAFYLAPNGQTDAVAELVATIVALRQPVNASDPNNHAQCHFPARYRWVKKNLPEQLSGAASAHCPALTAWLAVQKFEKVYLVFSSYYLNNPASMFGHTFLRLKREHTFGDNPALDSAVNFAANPTTANPLFYTYLGMTGGFSGTFALSPYYVKLQEYNNSESRDLWEYELDLNGDEVQNLLFSLWEVGPHPIDYYYFDENCSAILLNLLAAAKPGWDIVLNQPWVIPADTIRAIDRQKGAVKSITFRPSIRTQFFRRYSQLSAEEQQVLRQLLASRDATSIAAQPSEVKAKIIDAGLDYIDFRTKLVQGQLAGPWEPLRQSLLAARRPVKVPPAAVNQPPPEGRPDGGHPPGRIGIRRGTSARHDFVQWEWRPALHSLDSSSLGYDPGAAIGFFDLAVRYHRGGLRLKHFTPLAIYSLADDQGIDAEVSWNLALEMQDTNNCFSSHRCYQKALRVGAGYTHSFIPKVKTYALINLKAGWEGWNHYLAGPFFEAGVLWRPDFKWTLQAFYTQERLWNSKQKNADEKTATVRLTHAFSTTWEAHLNWQQQKQKNNQQETAFDEYSLGLFFYH